jgi:hypothetical protein
MAISRSALSRDPAAALASTLGLGSGVVLGAVVGGLFGGWLVLGGTRRVSATIGFLAAIVVVLGIWRLVEPSLWVIDTVMNQVFGDGGEQYSGIVILYLGFLAFRMLQQAAAELAAQLLARAP